MQKRLYEIIKIYLKTDSLKTEITYVSAGLTNNNYMVHCCDGVYIVRLAGPNTKQLGIDRRNELETIRMVSSKRGKRRQIYYSWKNKQYIKSSI